VVSWIIGTVSGRYMTCRVKYYIPLVICIYINLSVGTVLLPDVKVQVSNEVLKISPVRMFVSSLIL
jgi:hypothetical protein